MKNTDISGIFNRIADMLEIKGENPFRIRAYRRAALALESLGKGVAALSHEQLLQIPGIGKDLAGKIEEYAKTGKIEAYEILKTEVPQGVADLLDVPGIGPRTASMVYRELGVTSIDELERAAREHRLLTLPGVKEKTEQSILRGIETVRRYSERHPLGQLRPLAQGIRAFLMKNTPVAAIEVAGSIRRWKESVRDIDLICVSDEPAQVMRAFVRMPFVTRTALRGATKSSVVIEGGIQVDLRVVERKSYGAALAYFTGSTAHNIRLREIAVKAGLKMNEYGIFREKDDRLMGGATEEEVYRVLGMPWIPPELREDRGEVEAALSGTLPALVGLKDIRGDLHLHSNWSDGALNLDELISRSIEAGYAYALVTDHTRGLGVARGMREDRLAEQVKQIAALNRRNRRFRLLAGAEVNILSDGSLDLAEGMLKRLDLVVASVHTGFSQPSAKMTGRIMKAMRNPFVSIIGHISGRIIGARDSYAVNMDDILNSAAETGTALEINSNPYRLDVNDIYAKASKEKGISLVISTDAHDAGQFDYMEYGVAVARRGWLARKDVVNTLPAGKLLKKMQNKSSNPHCAL